MAGLVGATLLHYRILYPLGAGGMGEVYAADDTRLNRRIALKILPSDATSDDTRLQRFRREAQAVAALNHPNVVTIFSVEEADGVHFLTMELIEGRTLDALIPPGGLPWADFFRWALPLVDAVSAAHERGIVHRDLKPANVMIGAKGTLKVLDFGLAKLRADEGTAQMSAVTTGVTAANVVVGTAAYMSPEQAEGRAIDARTDIFSLGIMLYEMATGQRPFRGETAMALISSILKDPPPPATELRANLLPDLDRIFRRCLAKDPSRRYQTVIDLRNDLDEAQQHMDTPLVPSAPAGEPGRRSSLSRRTATVTLAAAALIAGYWLISRFNVTPPAASPPASFTQLTHLPGIEWFPSLSPDGRWIVFAADAAGNRDIYLQSVTGATPINLTEESPDDDDQPAFSPNGESIAFRSNRDGGGIFVMGRTGERVRRLTRAGFNPAWSPDGTQIAYATLRMELRPQNSDGRSELWVVNADGGEPRRVYEGDATLPAWSPNGTRLAFGQRLGENRTMDILTIAAEGTTPPVPVILDPAIDWNPVWAPDGRSVYFVSDRGGSPNIWRIGIDERSGEVQGAAEPLTTPATFAAHLSITADGRKLAYSSVHETQNVQRLRFDPGRGEAVGDPEAVTRGGRFWSSPDPSPDGTRIVMYSQVRPEGDLYVINADGTGLRQLTSDAAVDRVPRWSPDGDWIASFSNRSGQLGVWKLRADGSEQQMLTGTTPASVVAWSPDGRRLAVTRGGAERDQKAGSLIMDATRGLADPSLHEMPDPPNADSAFVPNSWSPDGTSIAGQNGFALVGVSVYDVRSRSFTRVSEFGEWPVWLPDSRRVLVVSRGREFHVIDTVTKASRQIFSVLRDTLGPPRLTRDGRAAYFSRRITESDVWLVDLAPQ